MSGLKLVERSGKMEVASRLKLEESLSFVLDQAADNIVKPE